MRKSAACTATSRRCAPLFADKEPAGRKLDFVVQEMNREFNTIGSKANDGELTKLVLTGKAEIERFANRCKTSNSAMR